MIDFGNKSTFFLLLQFRTLYILNKTVFNQCKYLLFMKLFNIHCTYFVCVCAICPSVSSAGRFGSCQYVELFICAGERVCSCVRVTVWVWSRQVSPPRWASSLPATLSPCRKRLAPHQFFSHNCLKQQLKTVISIWIYKNKLG